VSGAVVFLTGLSGAGKSTIAEALAADLRAMGRAVSIIDGAGSQAITRWPRPASVRASSPVPQPISSTVAGAGK